MCLGGNKSNNAAAQSEAANAAAVAEIQRQAEESRRQQALETQKLLDTVTQQNQLALDTANQQNQQLAQYLTEQGQQFASTQKTLFDAQKSAAAEAAKRYEDAAKNTGQAAKQPQIAALLKTNRQANRRGIGSTMLTGASGVPTANLQLGAASLLGGA